MIYLVEAKVEGDNVITDFIEANSEKEAEELFKKNYKYNKKIISLDIREEK